MFRNVCKSREKVSFNFDDIQWFCVTDFKERGFSLLSGVDVHGMPYIKHVVLETCDRPMDNDICLLGH